MLLTDPQTIRMANLLRTYSLYVVNIKHQALIPPVAPLLFLGKYI